MAQSILDLEPPKADRRVHYGSGEFHYADVRMPQGKGPFAVVMNIHGGFWRAAYDLVHAGHLCVGLTKAGLATFNVEYRRVGNPGGTWPGTFEDIRNAYGYLQQNAAGLGFDPKRILVMGHSAGGQLALCLAAHEPGIRRVVSLAGVVDLQRAFELHLSNDAVVEFLQGTPQQVPEHYREASPIMLKVAASQVLIAGDKDDVVPPEMSRGYVSKKKREGEQVKLVEIPKCDHFDLIDPSSEAFKTVVVEVKKLLA